ncbi:MAG: T9SS type A sorting domain-containing protein, partial [Candidatus Syntrophosphaera sp.]|nr:T9SS type A sorting domain-containing protein [Candidatus Syntrophosphaera sp.]
FADQSIVYMSFVCTFDSYTATTPVALILNAPALSIDTYQFMSDTSLIMPGDNPHLNLIVNNTGTGNAYSPLLILFSDDPNVTISDYEVVLSPIGFDSFAVYENVFSVQVSPNAESGSSALIGYMLGAENGNTLEGNFVLYIGMQNYNFETDMSGWSVNAPSANFVNQWHRSNARNFTPNGIYSMKFGGAGTSDYSGSAYGALVSPEIPLGLGSFLYFHHWMDAETHSTPQYAWDGGLVQISIDNGPWTQITPVGGYPYSIYSNPASPFPAGTNVYSGTFDWTQASFDLSSYQGTARFRYLFGSDGYVSGEGWYIDDVYVESEFVSNGETIVQTIRFELHENYPNPFNPTTTIRFDLPENSPVRLEIYNVKGQKVRSLLGSDLPKGSHSVIWNGLDDSGRPVSSGIYLYRLNSGSNEKTRKMMLMK